MDQFDYIDAYLKGSLSAVEHKDFEDRMKSESELQEKVQLRELALEALDLLREDEVRNILSDIDFNENRKVDWSRRIYWGLGLAAGISILILLSIWASSNKSNSRIEQFAQNESNYIEPNLDIWRNEGVSNLTSAIVAFESNEFEQCLTELNTLKLDSSNLILVDFIRGHCYYRLNNFEKSIEVFSNLLLLKSSSEGTEINMDNVGWTKILAQLELLRASPSKKEINVLLVEIDSFLLNANQPDDSYAANARTLKNILETSYK